MITGYDILKKVVFQYSNYLETNSHNLVVYDSHTNGAILYFKVPEETAKVNGPILKHSGETKSIICKKENTSFI